jgi:hypothetical protein
MLLTGEVPLKSGMKVFSNTHSHCDGTPLSTLNTHGSLIMIRGSAFYRWILYGTGLECSVKLSA